ncbi:MAG: glycosyltransferase [Candidatus Doudnabacteria bacterium]|jgi:glycosyltransferase involved in cell wall biosynthesis
MKTIVLMPTKNDAWILRKTLPCILMWADKVIISDQQSTDNTVELCKEFPQVTILQNTNIFHSTKVRQQLLDEARKEPGNNLIFSIDSDEVVTADILNPEVLQSLEKKPIGTSFQMQWVQLWRSTKKYRNDNSVWSNSYKHFAFIDDRVASYTYEYGVNDHNSRVPTSLAKNSIKLEMPKVLHYQFVNWLRMLAKQRFYRVQDFIQTTRALKEALKINKMYFIAKDESEIKWNDVPIEWTKGYENRGVDLQNIKAENLFWYDVEVLKWLTKYGKKSFKLLDIWDVDWDVIKKAIEATGIHNMPKEDFSDPRNFFIKAYHSNQKKLYFVIRTLKRTGR